MMYYLLLSKYFSISVLEILMLDLIFSLTCCSFHRPSHTLNELYQIYPSCKYTLQDINAHCYDLDILVCKHVQLPPGVLCMSKR